MSFSSKDFDRQSLDRGSYHGQVPSTQSQQQQSGYHSERTPLITKAPIPSIQETNTFSGLESTSHPPESILPLSSVSSSDVNNNKFHYGTTACGRDEEQQSPTPTLASLDFFGGTAPEMDKNRTHQLPIRALAVRELKILLRCSGPIVLTYVLQNSLQLASLISLGHLGAIGE